MHINEILLYTHDLAATQHFYAYTLGLPCIEKGTNQISYAVGKSKLSFRQRTGTEDLRYHFAFNIPYHKMDEALNWCRHRVTVIPNNEQALITDFPAWNARAIYFYDNNKNIVEFIGRADLDQPNHLPFSSMLIDNISEIGIATPSPLAYSEHLCQTYGIGYFTKGPKRKDFAALGDDHGLLIISSTERHWYPTPDAVSTAPLIVKFSLKQQSFTMELN